MHVNYVVKLYPCAQRVVAFMAHEVHTRGVGDGI